MTPVKAAGEDKMRTAYAIRDKQERVAAGGRGEGSGSVRGSAKSNSRTRTSARH